MMANLAPIRHGMAAVAFCLGLAGCGGADQAPAPVLSAPATPAPAPSPSPTSVGSWQLVWADEFDGAAPDPARWNLIEDCWGGGNNEQQCYTARPDNVVGENGALVITALEESRTGNAWPALWAASQADPHLQATKPFTSGKLTTQGKAAWLYGRFEIRARLPQGQGVWPAFWMMPEESIYGGWPLSGEIDIMEAVNLGVTCPTCEPGGENSILGTLHFGAAPPDNVYRNRETSFPAVLDGGFHTYGVIWEPGRFTWTIDGVPYGTMEADEWWTRASTDPQAPFDRPFHLILNLAIGGNWPESTALGGISTEGFPKRVEIDWVRVWQCPQDGGVQRCTGGN
ncbi:glycoside hydrolase family 16 protein [Altererythrobacter sp. KTW20L]|uniref:glycoside hydrolase family 16 protein n=1 Tax=Altererythrobacter sp. KTW20L TaxID=2942210 RepID=UPI0020C14AF0|nr:glycoside hydrolase family 16 protein [Altererythrobacter sp. KTW20L]MCL6250787.1 glycoside hydrolase family 16 protein [Altererythrobacter sp. KTW20L]